MNMNRRAFLTWVGVGWAASSLPIAIAACSSQTTEVESAPQRSGFQAVGKTAELNQNGQLLNKQSPVGPILVVRDPSDNKLIAVNPTCPHRGCAVAWQGAQEKFVCPCHGAEFSAEGKVLKGPAKGPLKAYAVKIENDSVLVE